MTGHSRLMKVGGVYKQMSYYTMDEHNHPDRNISDVIEERGDDFDDLLQEAIRDYQATEK